MERKLAVIGLGYVGLPLAVEFGKKYDVVGFDINRKRIEELKDGLDRTLEVSREELNNSQGLRYTSSEEDLKKCDTFIVTVPTPINRYNSPDLTAIKSATSLVGRNLKKGDIVIYESTVYPGCTEEDCVPILEEVSGLVFNRDFYCGYSPERINPGDKNRTLTKITKVTSGSTPEIAEVVDQLYASIITAGTHKASSIKVAEASKAIENAQRDINIAFVNELAKIFSLMGLDTTEVLESAATKWNFLPFKPGLVGGHCIGVDPFYLTHKATEFGYHPEIILAGRRLNDNMGTFVVNQLIKKMIEKGHSIKNSKMLVLGVTFKENCPDVRNTKVADVYNELHRLCNHVDVYDPWASPEEVKEELGIRLLEKISDQYDGVILAVGHNQFKDIDLKAITNSNSVVYDLKAFYPKESVSMRL
ncbi:MAG: nucleotide sugar dehydrogenase [Halobacteriovoraceae bacterium]|nr:nucleotide sugar dehydrogenase [Halobacteriovoraceae bacterium]